MSSIDKILESKLLGKDQIFLFDFDGTLVNTEALHWQAYLDACKKIDLPFHIEFAAYCALAHSSDVAFQQMLCEYSLNKFGRVLDWTFFYQKKKERYLWLVEHSTLELMPGVYSFLQALKNRECTTCVVTHSPRVQTELISGKLPILKTIDYWVTREEYERPKPYPDAYQAALKKVGNLGNGLAIGFEDSIRGLSSLLAVDVQAVLVSSILDSAFVNNFRQSAPKDFVYINSFEQFLNCIEYEI